MLLPLAGSPSQALTRQIPPFVAARHLPPARGKSFLKGRAFGSPRKLHLLAKASPFGRGGFAKQRRRGRGCYPLCSFKKRDTGTPAGVPVLQSLNREDQIRLRASSSPTRMKSGCSCRMLAGTSGVTGPKKAFLTISALPAPLTTISTLRACMMVRMPMV